MAEGQPERRADVCVSQGFGPLFRWHGGMIYFILPAQEIDAESQTA